MSQGIEGIRHFRKSLDISRNALAIEGFLELPRHLWEFQAFGEIFTFFTIFQFWETAVQQKKHFKN